MMAVKLLVKIAVMMMVATAAFRRHRERGGEVLPLASGGAGALPGAIIITAIFTNNFTAFITNSSSLYAAV